MPSTAAYSRPRAQSLASSQTAVARARFAATVAAEPDVVHDIPQLAAAIRMAGESLALAQRAEAMPAAGNRGPEFYEMIARSTQLAAAAAKIHADAAPQEEH